MAVYRKIIIEDCRTSFTVKHLPMDTDQTNLFDISDDTLRFLPDKTIGILGAGRLQTTLVVASRCFDSWEHGRCWSYVLPPFRRKVERGQYKNEITKRLAELVIYLGLDGKLQAYYYEARNNPSGKPGFYYFNGICKWISDTPVSPDFCETVARLRRQYLPTGKSRSGTTLRHQRNRINERPLFYAFVNFQFLQCAICPVDASTLSDSYCSSSNTQEFDSGRSGPANFFIAHFGLRSPISGPPKSSEVKSKGPPKDECPCQRAVETPSAPDQWTRRAFLANTLNLLC
ncbi:hypothetical protein BKA83DRAFT_11542 [Pisolithus microcarpus]|nr:hypothetical protein BKA83DRAFT_11542 [Pisolithus microcarpus]